MSLFNISYTEDESLAKHLNTYYKKRGFPRDIDWFKDHVVVKYDKGDPITLCKSNGSWKRCTRKKIPSIKLIPISEREVELAAATVESKAAENVDDEWAFDERDRGINYEKEFSKHMSIRIPGDVGYDIYKASKQRVDALYDEASYLAMAYRKDEEEDIEGAQEDYERARSELVTEV